MEKKIGILEVSLKQKYLNAYTPNFTTKIQSLISHVVFPIHKMVPLQSSLMFQNMRSTLYHFLKKRKIMAI